MPALTISKAHLSTSKGFTLIELVIVIILLGVLASATTQFIVIGINIYQDSSGRIELVDNARFAIERLNREVRGALPNSPRTRDSGRCLEFKPVRASGTYIDLVVAPAIAVDTSTVVTPTDYTWQSGDALAIYVLSPTDAYTSVGKIFDLSSATDIGNHSTELKFYAASQFASHSPSRRFYIINNTVSWCVEGNNLIRRQLAGSGPGVLMAQGIEQAGIVPFKVEPANLTRNALTTLELRFTQRDEEVIFHNEIQTPNQP